MRKGQLSVGIPNTSLGLWWHNLKWEMVLPWYCEKRGHTFTREWPVPEVPTAHEIFTWLPPSTEKISMNCCDRCVTWFSYDEIDAATGKYTGRVACNHQSFYAMIDDHGT